MHKVSVVSVQILLGNILTNRQPVSNVDLINAAGHVRVVYWAAYNSDAGVHWEWLHVKHRSTKPTPTVNSNAISIIALGRTYTMWT